MAQTIKMVIQLRRDTAANWELYKDIVPAAGEPCFVLDKNILKIGDGVTTFEKLEPINGARVDTDGKSLVFEEGVLKLLGFDDAEVGAQPRKNADGNIEWVVPSTDTVDGLQTTVAGLKSDVTSLQGTVSDLKEIVTPSGEGATTLLDRIESLEGKVGEKDVESKIDEKINEFVTNVSDDGVVNTLKELVDYVADHGDAATALVNDIVGIKELVGVTPVATQIADAIANSNHMDKDEAAATLLSKVEAKAIFERVKYEVSHKPVGTLVDYRDKEIRVMIPADTKFELQSSGANADANAYYIGFKAYAPNGAVSFKEDTAEIITDNTMHTFDGNDFAGVDAYGRKYSIIWLPVAKHADGVWTYYGANSSKAKYIGWHYSVEWYDANGVKIDSDCIRINLSNEACHNAVEPFYMANYIKGVKANDTLLDVVDGVVNVKVPQFKSSDEIDVAEDGTLAIKAIHIDKIIQKEDEEVVLNGGSAAGR